MNTTRSLLNKTVIVVDGEQFSIGKMWRNGRKFKQRRMVAEEMEPQRYGTDGNPIFFTVLSGFIFMLMQNLFG